MITKKKALNGVIPVTTTKAVYLDGTNKTLQEAIDNGELGGSGSNLVFRKVQEGEIFEVTNPVAKVYGNIVVSTTSISLNKSATQTFTVKLDKAPTNNQVVTISVNNGNATVNKTTLTFTPQNYNTTQSVTITGVNTGSSVITLSSPNVTSKTINVTVTEVQNTQPSEEGLVQEGLVSWYDSTNGVDISRQCWSDRLRDETMNFTYGSYNSEKQALVINKENASIEADCGSTYNISSNGFTFECIMNVDFCVSWQQFILINNLSVMKVYSSGLTRLGDGVTLETGSLNLWNSIENNVLNHIFVRVNPDLNSGSITEVNTGISATFTFKSPITSGVSPINLLKSTRTNVSIYDIRFYNRVLTDDEMMLNHDYEINKVIGG